MAENAPDESERRELFIGPVGPIPIVDRIDPIVQAQRKADSATAGALHTPEELQAGMYHERAGVRTLVVDRLVARGFNHPKTIPTLVDVVLNDPDSNPRFMAAMVLHRFGSDPRVVEALVHVMKNDPDDDVRAEALSSLDRLGLIEG